MVSALLLLIDFVFAGLNILLYTTVFLSVVVSITACVGNDDDPPDPDDPNAPPKEEKKKEKSGNPLMGGKKRPKGNWGKINIKKINRMEEKRQMEERTGMTSSEGSMHPSPMPGASPTPPVKAPGTSPADSIDTPAAPLTEEEKEEAARREALLTLMGGGSKRKKPRNRLMVPKPKLPIPSETDDSTNTQVADSLPTTLLLSPITPDLLSPGKAEENTSTLVDMREEVSVPLIPSHVSLASGTGSTIAHVKARPKRLKLPQGDV